MSEVNIEGVVDEIVKMVIASLKKDLAESVARLKRLEKALRDVAACDDQCSPHTDECVAARAALDEKP